MSELKCLFCQQELDKDPDGYYTCYTDNCGCWAYGGNGASGSESLWLTLIRTRKAFETAVDGLLAVWRATEHTTKQGSIAYNVLCDLNIKPLEQITALEQKDK